MDTVNKQELSTLSRVFSTRVLRELGGYGKSELLVKRFAQKSFIDLLPSTASLSDAFEKAFLLLSKPGNRSEYIYRNAIAQKILLGKHNLNTATMLNELWIGNSKADVVILNGTGTVYEIKSERDSFHRIENQVTDYRKVFASVNVVISPSQLEQALHAVPKESGIIVLSNKFHLQTVREAAYTPEKTVPVEICRTLREKEAIQLLRRFDIELPVMPNALVPAALRKEFSQLDPAQVHYEAVQVLKNSRSAGANKTDTLVSQLPKSLNAAVLSTSLLKWQKKYLTEEFFAKSFRGIFERN